MRAAPRPSGSQSPGATLRRRSMLAEEHKPQVTPHQAIEVTATSLQAAERQQGHPGGGEGAMPAASRAPPCARHTTLQLTAVRRVQRCRAGRRPLILAAAAGTPSGGSSGDGERGGGASKQSPAPASVSEPIHMQVWSVRILVPHSAADEAHGPRPPSPNPCCVLFPRLQLQWWAQVLQWPQQVVSKIQQEILAARLQQEVEREKLYELVAGIHVQALERRRAAAEAERKRQREEALEDRRSLQREAARQEAGSTPSSAPAKRAAPAAPPPVGPCPDSPSPVPGTAGTRAAAAEASAAAAIAWASAAAGHEAAAHAAAQRTENQPAAHAAAAADEWGRAAAAWRAAHDALDAAGQADPGSEAVQRAAAAVEAARAFRRQLQGAQE